MIQITTVLLLLASSAFATTFTTCPGITPPTEVIVEGCDAEPCNFIRGQDTRGTFKFIAVTTNTLTTTIKATTNGVTTNYPLPNPDACQTLSGAECPLTAGEKVTFNLSIPVLSIYPKVSLLLEFKILDDNKVPIFCLSLKGKVVDA